MSNSGIIPAAVLYAAAIIHHNTKLICKEWFRGTSDRIQVLQMNPRVWEASQMASSTAAPVLQSATLAQRVCWAAREIGLLRIGSRGPPILGDSRRGGGIHDQKVPGCIARRISRSSTWGRRIWNCCRSSLVPRITTGQAGGLPSTLSGLLNLSFGGDYDEEGGCCAYCGGQFGIDCECNGLNPAKRRRQKRAKVLAVKVGAGARNTAAAPNSDDIPPTGTDPDVILDSNSDGAHPDAGRNQSHAASSRRRPHRKSNLYNHLPRALGTTAGGGVVLGAPLFDLLHRLEGDNSGKGAVSARRSISEWSPPRLLPQGLQCGASPDVLRAEFDCISYTNLCDNASKRSPRPRYFNPCWVESPSYSDAIACGVQADQHFIMFDSAGLGARDPRASILANVPAMLLRELVTIGGIVNGHPAPSCSWAYTSWVRYRGEWSQEFPINITIPGESSNHNTGLICSRDRPAAPIAYGPSVSPIPITLNHGHHASRRR
eukprot:gene8698-biopygen9133